MKKSSFVLSIVVLVAAVGAGGCGMLGNSKISASQSSGELKTATMAPAATFKSLDGENVSMESLKGKVVLVNFWATWCEPCRIDIPWMIEFQQRYAEKGFTVLGVAMDDEGKSVVAPFVQKEQFDVDGKKMTMNYPIVLGNDDLAEKFGGILGLPTTFVVSRDGKIVKKFIGLVSHDAIAKEIESQL